MPSFLKRRDWGSEWVSGAGFLGGVSHRGHQWTEGPSRGAGLVGNSPDERAPDTLKNFAS